jgi:hypothetical protein
VKDENDDLPADCHNRLNRWKNTVCDVKQIEIYTAEPLVPDFGLFEFKTAIAKLKRYKSPGNDQSTAQIIQAVGKKLWSESINPLILFGIRKNCLISGRSLLMYQFITRVTKLTTVIIAEYHCY